MMSRKGLLYDWKKRLDITEIRPPPRFPLSIPAFFCGVGKAIGELTTLNVRLKGGFLLCVSLSTLVY